MLYNPVLPGVDIFCRYTHCSSLQQHTMEMLVCLLLCIITLGVCAAEQCAAPTLENGVVVAEQNLQLNTFTGTFQLVKEN